MKLTVPHLRSIALNAFLISLPLAGAQAMLPALHAQPSPAEISAGGDLVPAAVAGGEAPAQVKDDIFAGTTQFSKGASEVSEIDMDQKAMQAMDGYHTNEQAKKMDLSIVHTYTYDKPGMYRMEDVEVYRRKLQDGSWSCTVRTRDKDGSTDICVRMTADHRKETALIVAEPKSLTFIHTREKAPSDKH